jgi:multicomponent Na+:H+ antiporter subunit E
VTATGHALLTLFLLAGVWWLLSDGDPSAWLIGLPAVGAAAWSARRLRSPSKGGFSVLGLVRFLPFFFWESVRGGVDVAARTLAPRMRIRPGHTVFYTRLSRMQARVFFANCVSVLPGTLAADLHEDRLDIHLLDSESSHLDELRRLERAVARVYP